MKKALLAVLTVFAMMGWLTSCGDDQPVSGEDTIPMKSLVVENTSWNVIRYGGGWGGLKTFSEGDITVSFKEGGVMDVVNQTEFPILKTGSQNYQQVTIEKSIFDGKKAPGLLIDASLYRISFEDGLLHLSEEAYDGSAFTLKQIKD